jgi:hypothetical protein
MLTAPTWLLVAAASAGLAQNFPTSFCAAVVWTRDLAMRADADPPWRAPGATIAPGPWS